MTWYASFEFLYADGSEPWILLEQIGNDPLRLFRQIRSAGHVYRVAPDEPLASLQIASERMESECGPAPQRIRLSSDTLGRIRAAIHQKAGRR
ncbi:MAG: hypothetical protein GXY83_10930 [Rhodopirellula sp.]|nr:hypothetical protein [Rhodopirellula sp.]